MPRNVPPERAAQIAILRWARLVLPPGSIVASITNEHAPASWDKMAQARFQLARRAAGVTPGMPDLVCAIPGGRTVWIEVKTERGEVSVAQQDLHQALRALGHHVGVATDIDSARAIMAEAGVTLRETAGQVARVVKVRAAKRHDLPSDAVPF